MVGPSPSEGVRRRGGIAETDPPESGRFWQSPTARYGLQMYCAWRVNFGASGLVIRPSE